MTYEEAIDRFGLPASAEHRHAILTALAEELDLEVLQQGQPDVIRCLAAQLMSIGNVQDSLTLWRAKRTSFDLMCGLDIQFLCGAGVTETQSYLASLGTAESRKALKYLTDCIEAGDFHQWTAEGWVAYHRRYFGIAGETSADGKE